MASITIDNLDDRLQACLRARAERHCRSVEEEVLLILQKEMPSETGGRKKAGDAIRDCFADLGGVELERLPKQPPRDPPDFE